METSWHLAIAFAFLAGGCSCGGDEQKQEAKRATGSSAATQQKPEKAQSTDREPKGRLVAEYHLARGLSFRLEQLDGRDEYAGAVSLERKEGEGWKAVDEIKLSLHPTCKQPESCRPLRAGGMAAPPAYVWPVKIGAKGTAHAECPCEACMQLEPGEYRLVAATCKGSHRLKSESFWVGGGD